MRLTALLLLASQVTGSPHPKVTFQTPGVKTVTLKVCNARGECSTISKDVTVLDPKPAIGSFAVPTPVGSAEPAVPLVAQVSGKPTLTSTWTISGQQRTQRLNGPAVFWVPTALGQYQVSFSVRNLQGSATRTGQVDVILSRFADISPRHPSWDAIEIVAAQGLLDGCPGASSIFCPDLTVSRAEAAVLLSRALSRGFPPPPPATGQMFEDVPASFWAASAIEHLYRVGVTVGCSISPRRFCPNEPLSRASAAVFLLHAKFGPSFRPPPAVGRFLDVPVSDPAAPYIEHLAALGIIGGCSVAPPLFCPGISTTRAQAAELVTRTFVLAHNPEPTSFVAALCPQLCAYPAFMPLPFALSFRGGVPTSFDYDWDGNGTFEETSRFPVSFHTYNTVGTYRPVVRLRRGAWSAQLAHPPVTITAVSYSRMPKQPTNLRAGFRGTRQSTASDPPGTLPRMAFAVQATASDHLGYIAYLSLLGSPYRPVSLLPADLARAELLTPWIPEGVSAYLYLRPFNSFGLGSSSWAIPLTTKSALVLQR
jgi:S-layer family protein